MNHFHDPLREWGSAGLGGPVLSPLISSSPLWAQDSEGQNTFNERTDLAISALAGIVGQQIYSSVYEVNDDERDWSWPKVREYFHTALTSGDDATRQEYFAMTFRGVGHQMHLLEDMAVPEHVRNDGHGISGMIGKGNGGYIFFESWGAESLKTVDIVAGYAPEPVFPEVSFDVTVVYGGKALVPTTQLWDTDRYYGQDPSFTASTANIGLAEYTHANFFSDDTINMGANAVEGDYPYPNRASTSLDPLLKGQVEPMRVTAEDGKEDLVFYVSKIAGVRA